MISETLRSMAQSRRAVVDDVGFQALAGQPDFTATFAAFKWEHALKANHGNATGSAVGVFLNLAIRRPSEKGAAIFKVIIRNRFLLKQAAKLGNLALKLAVFLFKPVMYYLEVLRLLAQEQEALLKNRGTSAFVDEPVNKIQERHGGDTDAKEPGAKDQKADAHTTPQSKEVSRQQFSPGESQPNKIGVRPQVVECPVLYAVGETICKVPHTGALRDDALELQRGYCVVQHIECPRDYAISEIRPQDILFVRGQLMQPLYCLLQAGRPRIVTTDAINHPKHRLGDNESGAHEKEATNPILICLLDGRQADLRDESVRGEQEKPRRHGYWNQVTGRYQLEPIRNSRHALVSKSLKPKRKADSLSWSANFTKEALS